MSHLASYCDCGRIIHLPSHAKPGYVWTCRTCGSAYVLKRPGESGRPGVTIPSKAPLSGGMSRTCRDCGRSFRFTVEEQRWYAARGLKYPNRCPNCRRSRKAQAESARVATEAVGMLGLLARLLRG